MIIQYADAFRQLMQRKNIGKVLLSPTKAPMVHISAAPSSIAIVNEAEDKVEDSKEARADEEIEISKEKSDDNS